jgi:Protein of unknown function (DUF3102)
LAYLREIEAMAKAILKTRAQWAAEIRAAHKQSIDGILKMGRTLIAAKKALEHGAFEKMIGSDLPFDASTAQRLMKIARDPRIRKAARVQVLPMAWGTLYELTKLPDATFEQAISSGRIHPEMTRKNVVTIGRGPDRPLIDKLPTLVVRNEKISLAAPIYTVTPVTKPTEAPIIDLQSYAGVTRRIQQLCEVIAGLKADIRRGDPLPSSFETQIRILAGDLLSLVSQRGVVPSN